VVAIFGGDHVYRMNVTSMIEYHAAKKAALPKLVGKAPVYAYTFQTNRIPGEAEDSLPYWRDVGTIDAYYEANMDLHYVKPELNLYNRQWPLRSVSYPDPPAKFTFDDDNRRGQAIDSIVSDGCILSGGVVRNSILGRGVRVHTDALVDGCVIMDNSELLTSHFARVTLLLDGDQPGRRAAEIIAQLLKPKMPVDKTDLPKGLQPDQLSSTEINFLLPRTTITL